jgi:curved DNA-binding protein CbpA
MSFTNKLSKANSYLILSIPITASSQEIKVAYRKLALLHHPDKNPAGCEKSVLKFRQVSDAYSTLSDPVKKAQHDRDIGVDRQRQQQAGEYGTGPSGVKWRPGSRGSGFDHPSAQQYRPTSATPDGSVTGRAFDFDTWKFEHYGIPRPEDRSRRKVAQGSAFADFTGDMGYGNPHSSQGGDGSGPSASKANGANSGNSGNAQSQSYMGASMVGGKRETTTRERKQNIVDKMNARREQRILDRSMRRGDYAEGAEERESGCSIS